MKASLIALVAGASALGIGTAMANHHGGEKDWDAKVEKHFSEVDANNDGQVTRDEYLAYKAGKAEKSWDKKAEGAGDDGQISLDEAKAMHKAKMEKKKAKYKKMKEERGEIISLEI